MNKIFNYILILVFTGMSLNAQERVTSYEEEGFDYSFQYDINYYNDTFYLFKHINDTLFIDIVDNDVIKTYNKISLPRFALSFYYFRDSRFKIFINKDTLYSYDIANNTMAKYIGTSPDQSIDLKASYSKKEIIYRPNVATKDPDVYVDLSSGRSLSLKENFDQYEINDLYIVAANFSPPPSGGDYLPSLQRLNIINKSTGEVLMETLDTISINRYAINFPYLIYNKDNNSWRKKNLLSGNDELLFSSHVSNLPRLINVVNDVTFLSKIQGDTNKIFVYNQQTVLMDSLVLLGNVLTPNIISKSIEDYVVIDNIGTQSYLYDIRSKKLLIIPQNNFVISELLIYKEKEEYHIFDSKNQLFSKLPVGIDLSSLSKSKTSNEFLCLKTDQPQINRYNQQFNLIKSFTINEIKKVGLPPYTPIHLLQNMLILKIRNSLFRLNGDSLEEILDLDKNPYVFNTSNGLYIQETTFESIILKAFINNKFQTIHVFKRDLSEPVELKLFRNITENDDNYFAVLQNGDLHAIHRKLSKSTLLDVNVESLITLNNFLYYVKNNTLCAIDSKHNKSNILTMVNSSYHFVHKDKLYWIASDKVYEVSGTTVKEITGLYKKDAFYKSIGKYITAFSTEINLTTHWVYDGKEFIQLDKRPNSEVLSLENHLIFFDSKNNLIAFDPLNKQTIFLPKELQELKLNDVTQIGDLNIFLMEKPSKFFKTLYFYTLDKNFQNIKLLHSYKKFSFINYPTPSADFISNPLIFSEISMSYLDKSGRSTNLDISFAESQLYNLNGFVYFVGIDPKYGRQLFRIRNVNKAFDQDFNGKRFVVFPNPTFNTLTFDHTLDKCTDFNVYSSSGQKVYESSTYVDQIDVQRLKEGIYTILCNCDGVLKTSRFMKTF